MTENDRKFLEAVLRSNLLAFTRRCFLTVVPGQLFLPNWHIEAITYQLERIRRGEIRRLILTIPPRNLKSICASVAFPAFVLGHDPTRRIVCASYSQELAGKHARDCRAILESSWYKQLFPGTRIDPRRNNEIELETTARGYRLATSVGGTLTGRGGNLIIIDDPMKPIDAISDNRRGAVNEWFDSTLSSRLDQKTEDAIILVMQRLHVDDLVGHILERDNSWVHLNLPAIADGPQEIDLGGTTYKREAGELLHPDREPRAVLAELKASMGSRTFSAQYQQAPVPLEGMLVKLEWFRRYARAPEKQIGDRIVQSWDTASRANNDSDYSACPTFLVRDGTYYLLHVLRERLEYPDLKRRILSHAHRFYADTILIEDAGSGIGLNQELCREGNRHPIAIQPEGDKTLRFELQSDAIEAGCVVIPEEAPWLAEFLHEVLSFPGSRHDDQVDSLSQFLAWIRRPFPTVHVG